MKLRVHLSSCLFLALLCAATCAAQTAGQASREEAQAPSSNHLDARPGARIELLPDACLTPWEVGSVDVGVRVEALPLGATVRLLFRRLVERPEPFYFVDARWLGGNTYRALLPRPAEVPFDEFDVSVWLAAELDDDAGYYGALSRDWLRERTPEEWASWQEQQQWAPVEVAALLVDGDGEVLEQTPPRLIDVGDDCDRWPRQWEYERAWALELGVTEPHQEHGEPLGWLCEGILVRSNPVGGKRPDEVCLGGALEGGWGGEMAAMEDSSGSEGVAPILRREGGEPAPYRTVRVVYGTDRAREFLGPDWQRERDGEMAYGIARGRLELGVAEVSIPWSHEAGELEEAGLFEKDDPERHVLLLTVTPKTRDVFVTEVQQMVASADDKSALVFVHGYNVTFENAARRSAQMSHDLGYEGLPALYSWPSQGGLAAYTVDEANSRWTVPNLQEFLELLAAEAGVETIHVVAHSMGNRAVTEVLRRFAFEDPDDRPSFGSIVLAAPDLDADVFRNEIAPALAELSPSVTLYASENDRALHASRGVHGHPRAGDLSDGVVVSEHVVTIDASDVDTSLLASLSLGHSYFADKPTVLDDIRSVLKGIGVDARIRRLLRLEWQSLPYWKLRVEGSEDPAPSDEP